MTSLSVGKAGYIVGNQQECRLVKTALKTIAECKSINSGVAQADPGLEEPVQKCGTEKPSALSHSNRGYSLFNLTRASAVVNCQSAFA